MFDVWMRLLSKVDDSVLWLSAGHAAASANLRAEAERRGMYAERLVFAPKLAAHEDHLARHRLAGLFLDTLPCNARNAATDALRTGLPVLTCMGETFAARITGSLLHAAGLLAIPAGTHIIRLLPALNLRRGEADEGLKIIGSVVEKLAS